MRKIVWYISLVLPLLLGCEPTPTFPHSGRVSIAYLQSMATERSQLIEEDIYIEGWIVANDKLREIERAIVIDDTTAGVEIKIDVSNIEEQVPLFYYVRLRCSGLSLGREGSKLVIGAPPTDRYVVDRIAEHRLHNHLTVYHDKQTAQPRSITIQNIDHRTVLSYVSLSDLQLIDEECGATWCQEDETKRSGYANTLRHFTDGCDTLSVITSGESLYASEDIPTKPCTLSGIIDWYEGYFALRVSAHQIVQNN